MVGAIGAVDDGARSGVIGVLRIDVAVQTHAGVETARHAHHRGLRAQRRFLGDDIRIRADARVAQRRRHPVVVAVVGDLHIAATVVILAAAVTVADRLVGAVVFARRREVVGLVLRGRDDVRDLATVGDAVFQCRPDQQFDVLVAGESISAHAAFSLGYLLFRRSTDASLTPLLVAVPSIIPSLRACVRRRVSRPCASAPRDLRWHPRRCAPPASAHSSRPRGTPRCAGSIRSWRSCGSCRRRS